MRFECASRTDVGLKRKINQDSVLSVPSRALWAVADGMGGHEAGEVASALVIDALNNMLDGDTLDRTIEIARRAIGESNRVLTRMAEQEPGSRSIGTTIVGLVIGSDAYRCFWAGDSRAYLLRNGNMMRISRDHSLVQDMVDAGMLTPREAERHQNSNIITRAVGVAKDIHLDVVGGDALPGDRFLLASDGLTRVVSDAEIAAEMSDGPPDRAADRLIDLVLARGAPDNVSLIIVALS
nr:protein phosphatase 2C domain-containing protein [uncultured Sphingomonas sp.]